MGRSLERNDFSLELCIGTATGLIAAHLSGALASSLIYALLHKPFWTLEGLAQLLASAFASALIAVMAALFYGVPCARVVGWPVHLFLFQIRFTGVFIYACFAASLVVAFARIFVAPSFGFGPGGPNDLLELIAFAAVTGGVGGVAFWLIRRPDRDALSASPTP
jgi:hypothetical protein